MFGVKKNACGPLCRAALWVEEKASSFASDAVDALADVPSRKVEVHVTVPDVAEIARGAFQHIDAGLDVAGRAIPEYASQVESRLGLGRNAEALRAGVANAAGSAWNSMPTPQQALAVAQKRVLDLGRSAGFVREETWGEKHPYLAVSLLIFVYVLVFVVVFAVLRRRRQAQLVWSPFAVWLMVTVAELMPNMPEGIGAYLRIRIQTLRGYIIPAPVNVPNPDLPRPDHVHHE